MPAPSQVYFAGILSFGLNDGDDSSMKVAACTVINPRTTNPIVVDHTRDFMNASVKWVGERFKSYAGGANRVNASID
jgi:hypothetical protein